MNAGRTIAGTGKSTSGSCATTERGTGEPGALHGLAEELAVLGAADRVEVGADQLDAERRELDARG